jgi:hypothetical protein
VIYQSIAKNIYIHMIRLLGRELEYDQGVVLNIHLVSWWWSRLLAEEIGSLLAGTELNN